MNFNSLFPFKVVLASASPRRIELMRALGIDVIIKPTHTDESYPQHLKAEHIPCFLAEQKMQAVVALCNLNDVILTADTIVYFNGTVFNKPQSENEAFQMLSALSANSHTVYTAVSLRYQTYTKTFFDAAEVRFAKLEPSEIQYYISNFKPFDKQRRLNSYSSAQSNVSSNSPTLSNTDL